jgi:hypothetical protein
MELLIPGLILVALMVYASTRIKKTAAAAFDAETIDAEDFVINKPQGFLTVLNGDPQLAFESYSKDFGRDGAANSRKATAELRINDGASGDEIASDILSGAGQTSADIREIVGDHHYRLIERTRIDKGIEFRDQYKIAEKQGRVFVFKISSITETSDDVEPHIEGMLNSFELK